MGIGLGALPNEDAVYFLLPNDKALDASSDYIVRFGPGQLPPCDAFWSMALYDERGFPVPNPLDRHTRGTKDDLVMEPDGSLVIYISKDPPAEKDKERNWLPS